MLEVKYKSRIFHITETYSYGDPPSVTGTAFHMHSCLLPDSVSPLKRSEGSFTFQKLFRTLLIDLEKDKQELFNDFSKKVRYEIKRAERQGVKYSEIHKPSDKEIEEFTKSFNKFAAEKKIRPCNSNKLKAYRNKNAFVITRANVEESFLCSHGYIFDGERAIMLYSFSFKNTDDTEQRNLIGRANRYLHWRSILSFKKKGGKWYDLCGLSLDKNELQGINRFKKGFGGMEADELKTYRGKNLLGKFIIVALRWKWRNQPEFIRAKKILRSGKSGAGFRENA
ncbi:hypothetical protein V1502_03950 [Bacillus sp. SCS-153A]|uniref:hypothetical protein n=1 Tax=Rossellomorea sedimentorum TaxID=3115294 RepID=UPI00390607EF